MPHDDRIDNKRNSRVSCRRGARLDSGRRCLRCRSLSPRVAARARGARVVLLAAALVGWQRPLGPVGTRRRRGRSRTAAPPAPLLSVGDGAPCRGSRLAAEPGTEAAPVPRALPPGPETTVVDVGVTDAPFGAGSSDNFFEALYPWPERITAVGHTELDRFAAAFPARDASVRADGRELPFADGEFELGFSNAVIEHVAGGRDGPAAVPRRALPRRRPGLRDDPEPLVPGRPALAAPVRPLAAATASARERLLRGARLRRRARPARPARARRASSPTRCGSSSRGMTLVAVGPA